VKLHKDCLNALKEHIDTRMLYSKVYQRNFLKLVPVECNLSFAR